MVAGKREMDEMAAIAGWRTTRRWLPEWKAREARNYTAPPHQLLAAGPPPLATRTERKDVRERWLRHAGRWLLPDYR